MFRPNYRFIRKFCRQCASERIFI